nr:hypothetical protein [Tanacetum cinerariifolium]
MASLVLLLSEFLKHHDAEFPNTSSTSISSRLSSDATMAANRGGSCATAKRVTKKSTNTVFGVYPREEDLVEDDAQLRGVSPPIFSLTSCRPPLCKKQHGYITAGHPGEAFSLMEKTWKEIKGSEG